VEDLVLWWANYDSLEKVLLVNPILPRTLRIQGKNGIIKCRTMHCLSQILTKIFKTCTNIVQKISHPRERHNVAPPYAWLQAFARTVLSNILFLGSINFDVPRDALSLLEGSDLYDPMIFKLLHGLCQFTRIADYVPLGLAMQMPRKRNASFVQNAVMIVVIYSLLMHDILID
jgi:hypothetical protein